MTRTRQIAIMAGAALLIWMMMPDRGRTVISTAPGLSATFSPLGGVQVAAALAAAEVGLNVLGPPTISVEQIERVLAEYNSPAVGHGQEIYDLGVQYGINPAIALAFFVMESSAGSNPNWAGWKAPGATTHNIGNIECTPGFRCHGRWREYDSWADGIADWYRLIRDLYVLGWGRTTVEQIIPAYAPSHENDVEAFTNVIRALVRQWQQ